MLSLSLSKPNPTDWRINLIPIKSYPHSDIPINILQHLRRRRRRRVQLGELVPLLISGSTGNIGERGLCKMIYITCFVYDFDGLQCACLTGATWHGALSQRSSMTVLYGSRRGRKGGGGLL